MKLEILLFKPKGRATGLEGLNFLKPILGATCHTQCVRCGCGNFIS